MDKLADLDLLEGCAETCTSESGILIYVESELDVWAEPEFSAITAGWGKIKNWLLSKVLLCGIVCLFKTHLEICMEQNLIKSFWF